MCFSPRTDTAGVQYVRCTEWQPLGVLYLSVTAVCVLLVDNRLVFYLPATSWVCFTCRQPAWCFTYRQPLGTVPVGNRWMFYLSATSGCFICRPPVGILLVGNRWVFYLSAAAGCVLLVGNHWVCFTCRQPLGVFYLSATNAYVLLVCVFYLSATGGCVLPVGNN